MVNESLAVDVNLIGPGKTRDRAGPCPWGMLKEGTVRDVRFQPGQAESPCWKFRVTGLGWGCLASDQEQTERESVGMGTHLHTEQRTTGDCYFSAQITLCFSVTLGMEAQMLSFMGLTIALQSAQGTSSVPPLPEKTFGKCGGIGPFPREATLQSEWPWTGAGR